MADKITTEDLARMIVKGFEHSDKRFDDVYTQLDETRQDIKGLDSRMDHLDARMGRMEADLQEVRGNIVYKMDFDDLTARVKYIESKMGIESGK